MWVLFFNNINIKVGMDLLFDNFGRNCIVFFLFLCQYSCNRISTKPIYYISNFFSLEYGLGKIGPLKPIFKVTKLLFFTFVVIIFVYHFDNNLKERKIYCTDVATTAYTQSHNLIKSSI